MATKDTFIWQFPHLIAHRGGGKIAPENTLAGMRCAYEHGFAMVEFDVKLTKDNICIVMHDDDVKRTSNGSGLAAQMTFNEISALDFGSWHSAYYTGEPIPTLGSVLRFCQENAIFCNIEIKPCPNRDIETGQLVALETLKHWNEDFNFLLFSSFSIDSLRAAAQAAPSIPRALLIEGEIPDDIEKTLEELDCVALNIDQQYATEELVNRIHQAGYYLTTWTVNDYPRAKQLLNWGVDALFTDELDRITFNTQVL